MSSKYSSSSKNSITPQIPFIQSETLSTPPPHPPLEPNALVMTCSGRPAVRHLYNLKHTSPLWPFLLHALHVPRRERIIFCTTLSINIQYVIFIAFSGFYWNAANSFGVSRFHSCLWESCGHAPARSRDISKNSTQGFSLDVLGFCWEAQIRLSKMNQW